MGNILGGDTMEFKTFCKNSTTTYREIKVEHELYNKFYEIINKNKEVILSIPDGCVNIWFLWNDDKCQGKLIGSALTGKTSLVSNYEKCFGIKFNAGVVPELFLGDIGILISNNLPIEKYQMISFIEKEIESIHSFEQMVLYFLEQDFVFGKNQVNSLVSALIGEVNACRGNVKVRDLVEKLKYSRHYANEVFRHNIGMSIKQYSDIIRIQQAIYGIETNNLDFIYENLGYYDQSHFIRDFKRYTLLTPSRFLVSERSFI